MRTIKRTVEFKRDYKRLKKSGQHKKLDLLLSSTVRLLAKDQPLAKRFFDHALSTHWQDHRDCHLRPDLILIYRKPNAEMLELVRLGSHSQLSL